MAESLMVGAGNAGALVVSRAIMFAILASTVVGYNACPAHAQDITAHTVAADPFAIPVAEASFRFAIPEHWIRAVIAAESNNEPSAVSPKGAIGLMQVMPATYDELRARYHLSDDPLHVRDNIIAGTAYLREMLDRFGPDGFLAAYNAGPARYEEHLNTGRALPQETRDYVAGLASVIAEAREHNAQSALLGGTFDALETASADNGAASELAIPLQRIVDLTALQPSSGRSSDADLFAAPIFVPVNSLAGAVP
ncbi:lytic transglycosylase domain-containing protein [Pelagibacterium luteolum]|uniref:lytic transglycosylase domain-containing protein n=1 Tax=Pelagibacterium luteolum TaxID=440168 RepID=UPI001FCDEE5D|nr:lytic transglycosylase domain-containing protein [Pelagibacterium luteolum]